MRFPVTEHRTIVRLAVTGLMIAWLSPCSFAGVLAVDWGGGYVSKTQLYEGDNPANRSASDKYGDPHGIFTIDVETDSDSDLDDSITGRALSLTTPMSPPNVPPGPPPTYDGTSATFYGGGSVTRENSPLVNDGFSELTVLNQGPNDSIHFHVDTGGDEHNFHLLHFWDKSDFLNGLDTFPYVLLDDGGFFLRTSQSSANHPDEFLRWVVREGSQFYVSEASIPVSNNTSYTVPYSTLVNWAPYNPTAPTGTPTAADLLSLDFDETSSFSPQAFANVTGLGFYIEHEAATGPIHVHIEDFEASASATGVVPEPSTMTLFAIGGSLQVITYIRRRRRPATASSATASSATALSATASSATALSNGATG